ncbi:MAG: tRNA pseudouridine(13) synthase TruD [Planctomycetaceae bacterium]
MKLRRLPEDFQVTELSTAVANGGPFALYRLTKTSIGTPEAIGAINQRWQIHRKRISYGGLKDRHAVTVQYLTIHNGPRKDLQQKSFQLEYIGQTSAAYNTDSFRGNRFVLVLRDMTQDEIETALSAIDAVQQYGLPNYFDDQRFGSLGFSGEWIGRSWCLSDWERALWLALADLHEHDSSSEKKQKRLLQELWGQWPECQQQLERSHRRSIVTYLSDKVKAGKDPDFRGAFARISVDLRGLYLSAYQSALWNRLLSRLVERICPADCCSTVPLLSGPSCFPVSIPADRPQTTDDSFSLFSAELPLPSARIDRPEGLMGEILDQILAEEQMELRQLRVKYPRDSFFSKGRRKAIVQPQQLTAATAEDDLYPRRQKLTLSFDLPRGSYATILVKRLSWTGSTLESS